LKLNLLATAAAVLSFAAGAQARPFTAADLVGLSRVSDPQVSPDGTRVLYDLRRTDLAANKGVHSIWIASLPGGGTSGEQMQSQGATSARWSADGRTLFYLKDGQVWQAGVCAGECRAFSAPVQVTHLPLDVDSFRLSPDGRHLVVSMAVFPDAESPAATKAREDARKADKTSGQVYDKLFVRHWDTWADGTRNHLFALTLGSATAEGAAPVPLTPGFDGDVPGKPFGGDEDYSFSPDGKTVYFSARLAGKSEPWSTNFDVYRVPVDGSAAPVDLTVDNKAWDASPVVSPDGRTLAWRAMKRPGFESDRFTVWTLDIASGAKHELTGAWDRSPGPIKWSKDGESLYATADDDGATKLFRIDARTGQVAAVTRSGHVSDFDPSSGQLVYAQDSVRGPAQIYAAQPTGAAIALTHVNMDQLKGVDMGDYERLTFTGWNGETVHGWVIKPTNYQPGKRYPVAFLIHGGPQGSWTDSWSYRWNPQVYAGAGYGVVVIDFHGSTGYGQAFTDAISNHWGDRPLEDLQKGWAAALQQNAFLDGDRACALGASYGGYMINWIAGVWNKPWKCLVVHDGVFDDRMMGFSTEELWFSEWEHGGQTPWSDPAAYERFNPVNHVADWRVPQLVIHSAKDFRIPLEQGLGAFDTLQRRGIPSKLLTFPDENHWVLKPANSLLWHSTVLDWLGQWTSR
jgi:acylaminoacyl-peptidase